VKIFRVDKENNLMQFKEQDFKQENLEEKLESWLENNPHCILENEKILIIGRQVVTNLNSIMDLLAIDKSGDLIVIELKRDRTPRETIAQILEYASFVEDLSYQQLEEIFIEYTGEENVNLADYHRNYYQLQEDEAVAFNKNQKLLIVAQIITKEIKQTATYLRRKGLDFYCLEFKYFIDQKGSKIISVDFVVGEDTETIKKVSSGSLPRIDKQTFISSLDDNGRDFFDKILDFAENNNLPIHWGSKGFSLNVNSSGNHVNILYGYPPHAVYKQSIYTVGAEIIRKVENGETIVEYYKDKLNSLGGFEQGGSELKLMINSTISEKRKEKFLEIIFEVIKMIKKHGLRD
jgi:hypothetical protein